MRVVERGAVAAVVAASPIAQVAAEYGIDLAELGPRLRVGRCVVHEAAVGRSLLIDLDTGRFRCLTCSATGDVIALVMRVEGLGLLAALARLARRAGLDFDALFPEWPAAGVGGSTCGAELSGSRPPLLALLPVPLRSRRPCRATRTSEVPLWALTPPPAFRGRQERP